MIVLSITDLEVRLAKLCAAGRIELAKDCSLADRNTLSAITHDEEAYEALLEWLAVNERAGVSA